MRVYISGYGLVSSLGNTPMQMFGGLIEGRSAVRRIESWDHVNGLSCHLGAPASPYDKAVIPRVARRTMSPMSEMATLATQQSLDMANLINFDLKRSLLLMGSTTGSPFCMEEYFQKLQSERGVMSQSGTAFFKVMNHSVASNVAIALGFSGAVLAPSSACSTSAQSIILGWELLQTGLYDVAICGGADELHYLSAAVFDSVYAASRGFHDTPQSTPRPFDKRRDGLVVSEGAGVVILESEAHLAKRGGRAMGEIKGGAYLCESSHMSQSNELQMFKVITETLERANLKSEDVEYVNAHATGTLQGDAQEAAAIGKIFGASTPVSSLKAHFGHSMAACGAIEVIASLLMMKEKKLIGTLNLEEVSDDCKGINHLQENRTADIKTVLSNNFAFGGINTSLIIQNTVL